MLITTQLRGKCEFPEITINYAALVINRTLRSWVVIARNAENRQNRLGRRDFRIPRIPRISRKFDFWRGPMVLSRADFVFGLRTSIYMQELGDFRQTDSLGKCS